MITFKAKIKDSEEWIEGNSLVFETSMYEYIIFKEGMHWIDGREWEAKGWDVIDMSTLIIETQDGGSK
jgi:hypothetical protein